MKHEGGYRRRKSNMPDFRAMLDYFMGALMAFGGFFVVFSEKIIGYDYFEGSNLVQGWMKWFIGSIFVLYGIFRVWRGYQLQQMRSDRED